MEDGWLNATRAVEVLNKATQQSFTLIDLKRICATGHCPAYINCDGAEGVELETNKEVHAVGSQLLINPERLQVVTFEYIDQPITKILTISKNIVVKGRVHFHEDETRAANSNEKPTWKLKTEKTRYNAIFRSSDIEAVTANKALLYKLTKGVLDEHLQQPLATPTSISHTYLETVKELEQQLESERKARIAAEKELQSTTSPLKNSHLLTVAGLLELLLMEHNKPRYDQGRIATAIEEKGWRGASASTVTKLFAEAKVAANEAEKITQAKDEARDNAAKLRPKR